MLSILDKLEEDGDERYVEEFHHVFGLIGPEAISELSDYLADATIGVSRDRGSSLLTCSGHTS